MRVRYSMVAFGIAAILGACAPLYARDDSTADQAADEELLRDAKLGTTAGDLLALVQSWCGDDADLSAIAKLVRHLGSDSFDIRSAASDKLVRLGPLASPSLREALHRGDLESRRRAEICLTEINKTWKLELRVAAVRRLLRLHPDGADRALLRFLPWAADEDLVDEIHFGLYELAKANPRTQTALVAALGDRVPLRRAAAGCILGRLARRPARCGAQASER